MSKRGAAWEEEAAAAAKAARTDAGVDTHSVVEESQVSQSGKESDAPLVEASNVEEKPHESHAEEAHATSAPAAPQPGAPAAPSDAPVQEKKEGGDAQTNNDGQGRQAVCKPLFGLTQKRKVAIFFGYCGSGYSGLQMYVAHQTHTATLA